CRPRWPLREEDWSEDSWQVLQRKSEGQGGKHYSEVSERNSYTGKGGSKHDTKERAPGDCFKSDFYMGLISETYRRDCSRLQDGRQVSLALATTATWQCSNAPRNRSCMFG